MTTEKPVEHPLKGQKMAGAEMIIQVLADEGVDAVFGYSGGAILPTYDAIFRHNTRYHEEPDKQIRLIVPANEQGAGFMAAGYARASGKVGCFLVTSGPGATNTVTPIRDCMADSVPAVLICGQVPRGAIGSDAFQEAPVFNIMTACAKHVFLVQNPEELEATVRTAFYIARSGRPGPVVIDVPKDVQNWQGTFQGKGLLHYRGFEHRLENLHKSRVSKERGGRFFQLLSQCHRPLIYAGGGVINSEGADKLAEFADRFQIPVTTTLMGIGAYDTHKDLSLHMLGMHGTAFANYAVEDCDFLFAVGSRFDDRVAGKLEAFAPNVKYVAHIDIDAAEIGKVRMVDWSHIGDARTALEDLIEIGRDFKPDYSAWTAHIKNLKKEHELNYDKKSPLIQPQYVVELLSELTDGQAVIVTGVGQHQMWAAQYYKYRNPRSWITSGSMGTMGFGLPAAIGAQLARKDTIVVDIDGDGSIRMNLGEMETATTYDIPVKILLLNNLGDGMVRQWQKMYFGKRFSGTDKSLHRKDFIKAAQADGYEFAERISNKSRLPEVMKNFLDFKGPAFLEIMIDPDACVFPMVGPGMGYKEMVTGDFIKSRSIEESEKEEQPEAVEIPDLF
jgi:acetolactate synthase I/II/III large subunit